MLVLAILAGGLGFAYSYVTDSDTLAQVIRQEAPRFFPGSLVHVGKVQVRPFLGHVTLGQIQLWQTIDGESFPAGRIDWLNIRHDLREMLHGRFEPRDVVVIHPVLKLRRRDDGTWNVQGMLADPWPGPPLTTLPVITIEKGEVEIYEAQDESAVTLLSDLDLRIEPRDDGRMQIDGTARGGPFDRVQIEGTYDLRNGKLELSQGTLSRLALADPLTRRLPPEVREGLDRLKLTGGEVDVVLKHLTFDPARPEPIQYAASLNLRGGTWNCDELPFPLDNLVASASIENGVLFIDHALGRNGKTTFKARGWLSADDPENGPMDLRIDVSELVLDERLRERTPAENVKLWDEFQPRGWINLALRVARKQTGEEPKFGLTVRCQDVSIKHFMFPYALEHIQGTLVWQGPLIQVDLRTIGGGLTARGTVRNPGDEAIVALDFQSDSIPMDEKLMDALPPEIREAVAQFHPSGSVRGTAQLRRKPPPGPGLPDDVAIHASLDLNEGCSIQWDGMPYRVNELTGHLDLHPDHWVFTNMRGATARRSSRGAARSTQVTPGASVDRPAHEGPAPGVRPRAARVVAAPVAGVVGHPQAERFQRGRGPDHGRGGAGAALPPDGHPRGRHAHPPDVDPRGRHPRLRAGRADPPADDGQHPRPVRLR